MPLTLTLREPPTVPLETEGLSPDRLAGRRRGEIEALTVWHGNRRAQLADFFAVSGNGDEELRVEGDLRRVKFLGAGMTDGRLTVAGDAGMHTGADMRGGELVVEGDAGEFAGTGMRGGRLVVRGSAGHHLGGAYPGERTGMRGGEILVHGDAGDQVGAGLRRGLIAVAGRLGDAAGLRMLAGTIVARRRAWRPDRRGDAAGHDRRHVAGDAAAHLRLRVLVPAALPAPVPAPPARAGPAPDRRADRGPLRALVRRRARAAAGRDPDSRGRPVSTHRS